MELDFNQLKLAFEALRTAIGLAKDTKDLLPSPEEQTTLARQLDAAEQATRLAEVQVAQALGYQLCKCTFPPQIMLSIGYDSPQGQSRERFRCPQCGRLWPRGAQAAAKSMKKLEKKKL